MALSILRRIEEGVLPILKRYAPSALDKKPSQPRIRTHHDDVRGDVCEEGLNVAFADLSIDKSPDVLAAESIRTAIHCEEQPPFAEVGKRAAGVVSVPDPEWAICLS
jgi:hypothetical protein